MKKKKQELLANDQALLTTLNVSSNKASTVNAQTTTTTGGFMKKTATATKTKSNKKLEKLKRIPLRSKELAENTRRNPHQKNELDKKRKIVDDLIEEEYSRAVKMCKESSLSVERTLKDVSFQVDIKENTVRRLISTGRDTIGKPGRKPRLPEDQFEKICLGLFSFIRISQANGDDEMKNNYLIRLLTNLFKGN